MFNELKKFREWFHECSIERQNKTVATIKADNCCQSLFIKTVILHTHYSCHLICFVCRIKLIHKQ